MSDVNVTSTTESDYSAYYDEAYQHEGPCNNTATEDFARVFRATLFSLVFILGFIGNGLVACVLVKHRNQTNLTDICLFNLALSDLVFVFALPFFTHFVVVRQWTLGDFMCRFVNGSHHTGFFSSIFFMTVMTLDRYVVIMHAHKVSRCRTMRVGIVLTVLVWMVSVCVSLPNYIFSKVMYEDDDARCAFFPENKAWEEFNEITLNVLGLIIPLLVMIVCYSRIIPRLATMRTIKRHRAVKVIIAIIVVFFVCWAPCNIASFLKFLYDEVLESDCTWEKNLRLSVTVTQALAYAHCCLNPIVYAFVGQKFTARALNMLKKWLPGSVRASWSSSFRKSSVSRSSDVTFTSVM